MGNKSFYKLLQAILRALIITVSGLALAFMLQFLVFFSFKIPTPSMEPAVVAGDYVSDSQDSRYWGLVPEDHFVGKAAFVWKSKDMHSNKYRWKRFFTKIR